MQPFLFDDWVILTDIFQNLFDVASTDSGICENRNCSEGIVSRSSISRIYILSKFT